MSNPSGMLKIRDDDRDDTAGEGTEQKSKKRTLADLLEMMKRVEDEIDHCDIDLEELGQAIRSKIDGIVEYLDYCDEKAQTLRTRMKLFERKAKAYENRSSFLRQYVANQLAMDADSRGEPAGSFDARPCVSGDLYQMSLQYHDFVEVNCDANAMAFLKLGPSYVERRYSWNKRALKAALESKSEIVGRYAELKKRPHIKIDVKI